MSIAALITDLIAAGTPAELVGRVAAALAERDVVTVQVKDEAAERRRAADRERKANVRRIPQTSADSADTPTPPEMVPLSPFPDPIPNPPLNPPTPHPVRRERRTFPEFFEKFWKAYPRRDGSNPKQPAAQKFDRIVAGGVDPEAIISAARKLAAEMAGKDAKFVPQAQTWLNQARWQDEVSTTGPPIAEVPKFETHEEHLAWWRQRQGAA